MKCRFFNTRALGALLSLTVFAAAAHAQAPGPRTPTEPAPAEPTPAEPKPGDTSAQAPKPDASEPESDAVDAPPTLLKVPVTPVVAPETAEADAAEPPADPDVAEAVPGDPWGDADGLNMIAFRALFQTRYVSTFAERSRATRASYGVREEYLAQQGDGWGIRRLFLRLSSEPVKYVGFKAVLDFSELINGDAEDVLKQAYSIIRPIPGRLELVVGLFKIPFSTQELDPSARFELANFGPTNDLLSNLGYGGRDFGVQIMAAPLRKAKRMRISFGGFRGNFEDEHDLPAGALAGRIEIKPTKSLRFGADFVRHLRAVTYDRPFNTSDKDVLPNPPDPLYPAQKRWGKGGAYGIDARFKKKGFMLRGEAIYGDRVDIDRRYGATKFWSAWGLAAYAIKLGQVKLLPAFRAEWLDIDAGHGKGIYRTLSGSITTIAWSRVRFLVDVSHTEVEHNTPLINQPKPIQAEPYLALDNTQLTAQLQLEL